MRSRIEIEVPQPPWWSGYLPGFVIGFSIIALFVGLLSTVITRP